MSRHDTEHDFEDEGVFNFLDCYSQHDKEHDFDDGHNECQTREDMALKIICLLVWPDSSSVVSEFLDGVKFSCLG